MNFITSPGIGMLDSRYVLVSSLPLAANLGGTGIANAAGSTLTLGGATTISTGGTIALGGFTLTVPASLTVAGLAIANSFTAQNTITVTSAGATTYPLVLINNDATIATRVGIIFGASNFGTIRYAAIEGVQEGSNLIGLAFLTGTGATITEKMYITNGGLVKIGTTAATTARFHVAGDVNIAGTADAAQLQVTGFTTQTNPVGYFIQATATTNAIMPVMRLEARVSTTGTGGSNGLGPSEDYYAETATNGTYQLQGRIASSWIDSTNSTRKAKMSLSAYDTAARLGLEIEASGTAAKLGFFGAATIVQPANTVAIDTLIVNLGLRASGLYANFDTTIRPRAGTATANTSPFVLQSGTLLTVPEAGALEFDGTGIYLTPTNHRRFISLASDSIIASVTATTVAPTTLWTGVLNANELKAYRVYHIWGCGIYTTHDANDQCTLTVNFGGTTLATLVTPKGIVTNSPWHVDAIVTIRTVGSSGTASAHAHFVSSVGDVGTHTESFTINTTLASTATIVAAWSDTSNSLSIHQCWISTQD